MISFLGFVPKGESVLSLLKERKDNYNLEYCREMRNVINIVL